ncbi:MAG: carbohydrate-binding domain-containing protein [Ruminococcaceae bacterium]|nr:carbohydrate-binding domain-containing protein [Oscillospiraceae bacterium]
MKRCTKILSLVLALLMICTVLPIGMTVSAASTTVSTVYATVSTPVVGDTISTSNDCYTPTKGVKITDMNWTKENGAIYPSNTKFQAGVTYYCDIEFTVEDGYTFPASYTGLKGYINEKSGEISTVYYTDHAYVTVPFTPIASGEVYVGGVGMNNGDYLPKGSQSTTKTKPSDRYAYYNNGVLTLHNYTYQGLGVVLPGVYSYYSAAIISDKPLKIVVEGNCAIYAAGNSRYTQAIYFKADDNTDNNSIVGDGNSVLQLSAPNEAIYSPDGISIKDARISIIGGETGINVYGKFVVENSTIIINSTQAACHISGNLTVNNGNLNIISSENYGICVVGDLSLNAVTANITGKYSPIYTYVDPEKGNSADISIFDSTITFDSKEYSGIHSSETTLIYNSTIDAKPNSTGLYSKKDLSIVHSDITLESCRESIWCGNGNTFITSSEVKITKTDGDGIYCNGNLHIVSSTLTVSEATDCGIECRGSEQLSIIGSTVDLKGDYGIYSECDLFIDNSTLKAEGEDQGISVYGADISINDSNVEATSAYNAALIANDGIFTLGDNLVAKASTQSGGTLENFDHAKADNYRWVKITKPATAKIETQPKTTYAKEGATAKVTVKATGDGLKYEWYIKNSGATKYTKSSVTKSTYSTTVNSKSHGRRLYCVITDMYGNKVQSNTVLIRRQATITKQPSATVYAKKGSKATVKLTALGDGLTYTWYTKNSGASKYSKSSVTSATYSVTMADKVKGRRIYCVVKDKYGKTVQSTTFLLRESVSIVTQPKTVTVKKNATAKVTVKASGDGLKYTWYVKNAGASKYTKSSVTKSYYSTTMNSKSKNRLVYCVVTDKYGKTVKSNTVTLKMK